MPLFGQNSEKVKKVACNDCMDTGNNEDIMRIETTTGRPLLVKRRVLFIIVLLCAAVASVRSVHAATITIVNTNDSGTGSLRRALADANDCDSFFAELV